MVRAGPDGVYEGTLAVTDGAGARRTDHLRVVVVATARPEVTVSGPSRVRAGEEATYAANVTSEDWLQSMVRTADGREVGRTELSGRETTTTASVLFEAARRDTVRATVYDVDVDAGFDSVETTAVEAEPDRPDGSVGGRDRFTVSASSDPDTSLPPSATSEPLGEIDISQSSQLGEYVDPEPTGESEPSGGLVEKAVAVVLAGARLAADAMLV